MWLDPSNFYDRVLLYYPQFYDRDEIAFLRVTLQPGGVFVNVGAHIGFYSLLSSRLVGREGTVIAIEAESVNYQRLCDNLHLNQVVNVRPVKIGVSDRFETSDMTVNTIGNRAASSFLFGAGTTERVACQPLLSVVEECGVERIDCMKMDIEGYEYRTLTRFFADSEPRLLPAHIIVEVQPWMEDRAGGNVVSLLERHGYGVYRRCQMNYILRRG